MKTNDVTAGDDSKQPLMLIGGKPYRAFLEEECKIKNIVLFAFNRYGINQYSGKIMEEYIIKNILKNNPGMSQEDAEKEAHRIQSLQ